MDRRLKDLSIYRQSSSGAIRAPRLGRALLLECALIGLALAAFGTAEGPAREAEPAAPTPPEQHVEIKTVHLEPPEKPAPPKAPLPAPRAAPPASKPRPKPMLPPPLVPPGAPAAPATAAPIERSQVDGVPLRVFIPSDPSELERYLRKTGGCLLVSRLEGSSAQVREVYRLVGGKARLDSGPPCAGVPRLIHDAALERAIGDPIGEARTRLESGGELVLQVILAEALLSSADAVLREKFGALSREELARRAQALGYVLQCWVQPDGSHACK